jgi:AcrR family transcriptional regulator
MGSEGLENEIRWVKPPIQARSQASLSRILDAAQEVIAERGFAGATVAEIVKRAKSSIGVFYDRFDDKEALLDCLHSRFCEESYATADDALDPKRWRDAGVDEILSKLVGFLVQIVRENRGILRAFLVRCGTDRPFAARTMSLHEYISRKLAALVLEHRDGVGHPDPPTAVEFGMRLVGSALDSFVLFDEAPPSGIRLDDAALPCELTRAFAAYLMVELKGARKAKRPMGRQPVG